MMKDESGTMQFIKSALKANKSKDLFEKLLVVRNTFLTHRQIGQVEAFYRLFPAFRLSNSNFGV